MFSTKTTSMINIFPEIVKCVETSEGENFIRESLHIAAYYLIGDLDIDVSKSKLKSETWTNSDSFLDDAKHEEGFDIVEEYICTFDELSRIPELEKLFGMLPVPKLTKEETILEAFDIIRDVPRPGTIEEVIEIVEKLKTYITVPSIDYSPLSDLVNVQDINDVGDDYVMVSKRQENKLFKLFYKDGPSENILILEVRDKKKILPRYLYHYLFSEMPIIGNTCSVGALNKELDVEKFLAMEIPLLPLERQEELIKILDPQIGNLNVLLEQEARLKNQLYSIMSIGEKCNHVKLSSIFKILEGDKTSKNIVRGAKCPYYGYKLQQPEGFCEKETLKHPHYLLLVACNVNKDTFGTVYQVHGPSGVSSRLTALIPKRKDTNMEYLYHYLCSAREKFLSMEDDGYIQGPALEEFMIPLPSLFAQDQISRFCTSQLEAIESVKKALESYFLFFGCIFDTYLGIKRKDPEQKKSTPKGSDDRKKVLNPRTRKEILVGGKAYNALLKDGYEYDEENNALIGEENDMKEVKEAKKKKQTKREKSYEEMSVADLRSLCRDREIKGYSKMKKDEIIETLEKYDRKKRAKEEIED